MNSAMNKLFFEDDFKSYIIEKLSTIKSCSIKILNIEKIDEKDRIAYLLAEKGDVIWSVELSINVKKCSKTYLSFIKRCIKDRLENDSLENINVNTLCMKVDEKPLTLFSKDDDYSKFSGKDIICIIHVNRKKASNEKI